MMMLLGVLFILMGLHSADVFGVGLSPILTIFFGAAMAAAGCLYAKR